MKEDLFDKLFKLPGFRVYERQFQKNREVLLYLLFGGLTFLVSVVSFALFSVGCGINELISNVFSWVLAVLFAYATNRVWVFRSSAGEKAAVLKEIVSFFGGRIATLVIEEMILLGFVTLLQLNAMGVKIVAQVVVIVLNYIISKWFVFK